MLIVVNPYKDLGLTTDDYVRLYKGKFRHELPPHIFALAEETYRAMKNEKTDQCVIISGESGAGKSVSHTFFLFFSTQTKPQDSGSKTNHAIHCSSVRTLGERGVHQERHPRLKPTSRSIRKRKDHPQQQQLSLWKIL